MYVGSESTKLRKKGLKKMSEQIPERFYEFQTEMSQQNDAADQNFDYMFKLLIIGNSAVGKTSFLFRLVFTLFL